MRNLKRPIILIFVSALVFSALETIGLASRNLDLRRTVPWYDPLWRPLPHWLTMALVAPLAIVMSHRFRVRPGEWRWVPLHAAAALAFGLVHITLGAWAYHLILGGERQLVGIVRGELAFDIALEVMSYIVLCVATHAYLSHDDARREREATQRVRADLAQARLRILRTQLQPHLLFNTLQAISTLGLRQDGDGVASAIARLGDVLRVALDEEGTEVVALGDELHVMDAYLEIQRLRLGERLQVIRELDPAVLRAHVPRLILQPLVENALTHGLSSAGPSRVTLQAARVNGCLELSVSDNGEGVPHTGVAEGTGLRVTRERLRELYGDRQSFVLETRPEGGTRARMTLPYSEDEAAEAP